MNKNRYNFEKGRPDWYTGPVKATAMHEYIKENGLMKVRPLTVGGGCMYRYYTPRLEDTYVFGIYLGMIGSSKGGCDCLIQDKEGKLGVLYCTDIIGVPYERPY